MDLLRCQTGKTPIPTGLHFRRDSYQDIGLTNSTLKTDVKKALTARDLRIYGLFSEIKKVKHCPDKRFSTKHTAFSLKSSTKTLEGR
jgi:hypothetical protein